METATKDWTTNVPDPAGVSTDPDKVVENFKITADTVDPHYAANAEPVAMRQTHQRVM